MDEDGISARIHPVVPAHSVSEKACPYHPQNSHEHEKPAAVQVMGDVEGVFHEKA